MLQKALNWIIQIKVRHSFNLNMLVATIEVTRCIGYSFAIIDIFVLSLLGKYNSNISIILISISILL